MNRWLIPALLLTTALIACPVHAQSMFELCQTRSQAEAVSACSAMLNYDGLSANDRVSVLFKRGRAYFELGQYEKAIGDLDQVLRLGPAVSRPQSDLDEAQRIKRLAEYASETLQASSGLIDAGRAPGAGPPPPPVKPVAPEKPSGEDGDKAAVGKPKPSSAPRGVK